MKIEPAGHRVIVKPDPLNEVQEKEMQRFEKLKESGFEVAETGDKKRMQSAVHTGILMAIGVNAWKAYDDGIPWAQVGDRVHFAKYGGYVFEEGGIQYRLLNDEDITAIIRNDNLVKSEIHNGLFHRKQEGCPVHPNDTDADLSDEQYARQLNAYIKANPSDIGAREDAI